MWKENSWKKSVNVLSTYERSLILLTVREEFINWALIWFLCIRNVAFSSKTREWASLTLWGEGKVIQSQKSAWQHPISEHEAQQSTHPPKSGWAKSHTRGFYDLIYNFRPWEGTTAREASGRHTVLHSSSEGLGSHKSGQQVISKPIRAALQLFLRFQEI